MWHTLGLFSAALSGILCILGTILMVATVSKQAKEGKSEEMEQLGGSGCLLSIFSGAYFIAYVLSYWI